MNTLCKPFSLGLTTLTVLALLLSSALVVWPVSAATTLVVTSVADAGVGSLRQAIEGISPGGTIKFHSDLSGQIIILNSTLVINKNLVIDGSDPAETVIISGNEVVRVFNVTDSVSSATLKDLTIMNGNQNIDSGDSSGAGIQNYGHLNVINCTLSNNETGWNGGGIYNYGTLVVEDSIFISNRAKYFGGAIHNEGYLSVNNSVFSGNSSDYWGGGLSNRNDANIFNSSFLYNAAGQEGGGILNEHSMMVVGSTLTGNSALRGGGIATEYFMTITNSTLSANSADEEGGGIWNGTIFSGPGDVLSVINTTLYGNESAIAGGIKNEGSLRYINTIITHSLNGDCVNTGNIQPDSAHNLVEDGSCFITTNLSGDPELGSLADNGGLTLTHALRYSSPAIDAGSDVHCQEHDQRGIPRPQGAGCDIGAFEVETMIVTSTSNDLIGSLREAIGMISPGGRITFSPSLSGGTITLASPLVINKNLTIDGSDLVVPITISGNNAVQVFQIGVLGEVTLSSLRITNGRGWLGGGINNQGELRLIDSIVTENQADFKGGGIFTNGTLHVERSTFSHNQAELGGGIRDEGVQSQLTVTDSTFFGNQAAHGGAIDVWGGGPNKISTSSFYGNTAAASGGAIRIWSSLTVENSTLSGNNSDSIGGGFNVQDSGVLKLQHATLSENTASSGGGIYVGSNAALTYIHTIIAHSTNGDCVDHGTIHTESTHNLVEDGSCPVNSYTNMDGDPKLGPLSDNGGPTLTHALLPGSLAMDAGSMPDCLSTDQRGFYRPFDGNGDGVLGCDIGAFEFHFHLLYLPMILK
jgi:predicted outer membrane repeat protein